MEPFNSTNGFTNIDPLTGQPATPPTSNTLFNFDWEYVWHCHILSHEENDMMRNISFIFPETLSSAVSNAVATPTTSTQTVLSWTDPTPAADPASLGNTSNEIGFRVERSTNNGPFTFVGKTLANATSFTDTTVAPATKNRYNIIAFNAAGDSPATCTVVGDVNGDGVVNLADYNIVRANWLQSGAGIPGDINGDGIVNLADFNIVRANWLSSCP